jgi:hypothetical protein
LRDVNAMALSRALYASAAGKAPPNGQVTGKVGRK